MMSVIGQNDYLGAIAALNCFPRNESLIKLMQEMTAVQQQS